MRQPHRLTQTCWWYTFSFLMRDIKNIILLYIHSETVALPLKFYVIAAYRRATNFNFNYYIYLCQTQSLCYYAVNWTLEIKSFIGLKYKSIENFEYFQGLFAFLTASLFLLCSVQIDTDPIWNNLILTVFFTHKMVL